MRHFISNETVPTTPRAPLLWEYFIGVNLYIRTYGHVRMCIIHMRASHEAGFNGNQRARIFTSGILISIIHFISDSNTTLAN